MRSRKVFFIIVMALILYSSSSVIFSHGAEPVPDQMAYITEVLVPETVQPGESFTITITFAYDFPLFPLYDFPIYHSLMITFDSGTFWVGSDDRLLVGEGFTTFSFDVTAPMEDAVLRITPEFVYYNIALGPDFDSEWYFFDGEPFDLIVGEETDDAQGSFIYGSVVDGHGHKLPHVKVTLTWNEDTPDEKDYVGYTDRNGSYRIRVDDPTFHVGSDKQGYLMVELVDEGGTIAVYDEISLSPNPVQFLLKKFTIETEDDLERTIDASDENAVDPSSMSDPKSFDDLATIYYYSKLASIFAEETLGLKMDHNLPVEIIAFSTTGTSYLIPSSKIYIHSLNTNYTKNKLKNSPDNCEFHEFGHHIMADSTIDGDNEMPTMPAGDTNHGLIKNQDSTDSWREGFAEFISIVMKDVMLEDTRAYMYKYDGIIDNLEGNFRVFEDEEFAVAGVLWDLYDGINETDHDNVQMTLEEIWDILNQENLDTFYYVYFALQLQSDVSSEALDEIFISHGFYNDTNGNKEYDSGEPVGTTSWNTAYPNRENKPVRQGSYIYLSVVDERTGENIADCTLRYEVQFDPPFEDYSYSFTKDVTGLPGKVSIVMPPGQYSSRLVITPLNEGYPEGEPIVVLPAEYWNKVNMPDVEYVSAHTSSMGLPSFSAQLTDVEAPSQTNPGETFDVTITVDYEFSEPTEVSPGIFDVDADGWIVEEYETLVGEGTKAYSFELTAPEEEGTWSLEAAVWYKLEGGWTTDEVGWVERFDIQVRAEVEEEMYRASVVDLEAPYDVFVGEVFSVEFTVFYEFTVPTEISPGIIDVETEAWLAEEFETLVGEGTKTYSFELTAPEDETTWSLEASAWYKLEGEWTHDEEEYSDAFEISVVEEEDGGGGGIPGFPYLSIALGLIIVLLLRDRLHI